jgi:hypothetical protein
MRGYTSGMTKRVLVAAMLCVGVVAAQDQPQWMQDLAKRHEALVAANGPGTDAALREQLLKMKDQDQQARGVVNGKATDASHVAANLDAIDAALTAQLKEIVKFHGWPTISMVGIDASNGAALILIHSRDHAWQRELLPQLESLADSGKIDGAQVALAVDKELVSEGKLQRYGTQFKFVDGGMAMYAVEDPAGLDARRAAVFLPPMGAYKQMLADMYHLKATDKIVMATPPAPTGATPIPGK